MNLITESIPYHDGDTELTGVLCWDSSSDNRRPGILVVHGGAGLDDHAKKRAQQIAAQGFVTFACDMYGSGIAGDRQRVMARLKELTTDPTKLCLRAQAGLDILAAQHGSDGRFAAVGYCFGGLTVLELARSGAVISGVASIHGSLHTTRPAQPGAIKSKILVCHGALDPHVPMTQVTSFMDEMNHAGADWQFIAYGRALHGFTHESGPLISGVGYHAVSDQRSRIALRSFFAELFNQDATR
jgi:dienelactone hydrolase